MDKVQHLGGDVVYNWGHMNVTLSVLPGEAQDLKENLTPRPARAGRPELSTWAFQSNGRGSDYKVSLERKSRGEGN